MHTIIKFIIITSCIYFFQANQFLYSSEIKSAEVVAVRQYIDDPHATKIQKYLLQLIRATTENRDHPEECPIRTVSNKFRNELDTLTPTVGDLVSCCTYLILCMPSDDPVLTTHPAIKEYQQKTKQDFFALKLVTDCNKLLLDEKYIRLREIGQFLHSELTWQNHEPLTITTTTEYETHFVHTKIPMSLLLGMGSSPCEQEEAKYEE